MLLLVWSAALCAAVDAFAGSMPNSIQSGAERRTPKRALFAALHKNCAAGGTGVPTIAGAGLYWARGSWPRDWDDRALKTSGKTGGKQASTTGSASKSTSKRQTVSQSAVAKPRTAAAGKRKVATAVAGKASTRPVSRSSAKAAPRPAAGKAKPAGRGVASKAAARKTARPAAPRKSATGAAPSKAVGLAAAPASKPASSRAAGLRYAPEVAVLRKQVLAALDELKAKDVVEIDIRGKASFADLLVIASGNSTRHVKGLADEVVRFVKKAGMLPLGIEGEKEAEWVLVDLGDIVCHIMLPRIREFYALERLWTVGPEAEYQAAND